MAEDDAGSAAADAGRGELRAIQDVADELGLTTRALRFYEAKGLVEPDRVGTMRVYGRREVARLRLVLRGKRLGFSIAEIKDFLDLYDADPLHAEQMRHLIHRIDERLAELQHQQAAIEQTIVELHQLRTEADASLTRIESTPAA